MPNEGSLRAQIVEESRSWIGTPYVSNGLVKGRRGGVDCAMILVGVFTACGLIPKDFDPRPYPPQWHMHRDEERYLNFVMGFADEISEQEVLPGDLVLFKIGRLFAHGGIVDTYPTIIHARSPRPVINENFILDVMGKHALSLTPRRYFSVISRVAK